MKTLFAFAVVIVAVVVFEIVAPGRAVYESGWFNAALGAVLVLFLFRTRRVFARQTGAIARIGVGVLAFGVGLFGLAVIANGLLAPSNHTIVGAPGSQVRVAELGGSLAFPPTQSARTKHVAVHVIRPGRAILAVRGSRYFGATILRIVPRTVVLMNVQNDRGANLTITQPNGSTFLSPVLLMQARQTIDGLDLPYDSFAIPALHRLVRAVLFTPHEAARFDPGAPNTHGALLFAVDDDLDRPLPHAIRVAPSGIAVHVGGVMLRGDAFTYPAIEIISAPSELAVIIGSIAILAGIAAIYFSAHFVQIEEPRSDVD